MKLARIIYRLAGVYGLLVVTPMLFTEHLYGEQNPPAVTHPEFYYGFVGVTLAWQLAFFVIGHDPARYRPLMPVTWVEKFAFLAATVWLFSVGRLHTQMLIAGLLDGVLGALFVVAFLKTRPAAIGPR